MGLQAQATISEVAYNDLESRVIPRVYRQPIDTVEKAIEETLESIECQQFILEGGGGYSLRESRTKEAIEHFRSRVRAKLRALVAFVS